VVKRWVAITMYLGGWMNSEGRALVRQNKNDICFFFCDVELKVRQRYKKETRGRNAFVHS
jgi:hypothetical protein